MKPEWIENKHREAAFFDDGDEFVIAVRVKNNKTGKESWDIDRVYMDCDGENAAIRYVSEGYGEYYDKWQWSDVEYYIPIKAQGPYSEEEYERRAS